MKIVNIKSLQNGWRFDLSIPQEGIVIRGWRLNENGQLTPPQIRLGPGYYYRLVTGTSDFWNDLRLLVKETFGTVQYEK